MARLVIHQHQATAQYFTEELEDGVGLEMNLILGGSFLMGTEDEEIERLCQTYDEEWFRNESPQHKVIIPTFFMGRYPITQEQWRIVAGWKQVERILESDPSEFKDNYEGIDRWQRPVENISWSDAKEFCARLSQKTKREYRLPTEAEWEYACRAGTSTPFHFGETISTDLANYRGTDWEISYRGTDWEINDKIYPGNYGEGVKGEYRQQTTPIGYFKVANNFGLYDMHGQVWEWCEDDWHENYYGASGNSGARLSKYKNKTINHGGIKIRRGGSWLTSPHFCRSSFRFHDPHRDYYYDIGFRVVCVVPRTIK